MIGASGISPKKLHRVRQRRCGDVAQEKWGSKERNKKRINRKVKKLKSIKSSSQGGISKLIGILWGRIINSRHNGVHLSPGSSHTLTIIELPELPGIVLFYSISSISSISSTSDLFDIKTCLWAETSDTLAFPFAPLLPFPRISSFASFCSSHLNSSHHDRVIPNSLTVSARVHGLCTEWKSDS